MKNIQARTREEDSQQYKFRTRAFEIDSIIELDISTLGRSLENGSSSELKEFFLEWKELVSDYQHAERVIYRKCRPYTMFCAKCMLVGIDLYRILLYMLLPSCFC